jgi:homoserine dehydrogenase
MDFRYARELGFAIKLLAICKNEGEAVEVRVHPVFIPEDSLLAGVNDVYNGVLVEGDLVGRTMFYGEGAGPNATSSAVVADILAEAGDICRGTGSRSSWRMQPEAKVKPMAEVETRYYLRMIIADRAGVLAQISKALGDNRISIASVIQKETDSSARTAEVVLMTHRAQEKSMQQALAQIEQLPVVRRIGSFIRVEDKEKVK